MLAKVEYIQDMLSALTQKNSRYKPKPFPATSANQFEL